MLLRLMTRFGVMGSGTNYGRQVSVVNSGGFFGIFINK
jgi:hypothetical protein